MDHMEYSIAMPPYVELTNAGAEWTKMKQRLYIHLNSTSASFHQSPPNMSSAFLINISLEQVQKVFNMNGLSKEETVKFNKILKSIEDICLPTFLIIYNRYRFFTCKQNGPEFNGFLQQLLAWSDLCEFGELKDILLKDCIISGISEDSVRQHLLRTEQLDFDKTVEICKAGLVKKYGTETVKSKDMRKDAWTTTEQEMIQDKNDMILNTEMIDEATNTLKETGEKESQTEILTNLLDERFETTEERDIVSNNEVLNGSIMNKYIGFHPLFPSNNDNDENRCNTIHSESDISDLNDKYGENDSKGQNIGVNLETHLITLKAMQRIENDTDDMFNGDTEFTNGSDNKAKDFLNCPPPNLSFSDEQCIQQHEKLHLTEIGKTDNFKCIKCDVIFTDAVSLQNHKRTHKRKGEKCFQCKSCPSSFYTAAHLKVHSRLHTGERPFVCDTCGKAYAEASKLKTHLRNHTGERPYKCPDCTMTFKWSSAFNRHRRTHTGERPYNCNKCDATFADITSLQRHTRAHTKVKPYMCMCGSSFTDPSALRVHKRIHTGERPYSCSVCKASFIRAQHLKEHTKVHSGEKPHECKICHTKFSEASKLKSHMRKHTGEKPYLCKLCGRRFSWTAAYNRHLKTHTLEKPYLCRICGRSFADNSTLVRHRRTHTGERPYHCTHCTSSFADSSSLSRHLKIHAGVKSFTCDICSASFSLKSYLNRHLRTHSGEKCCECDICNSKFSDSSKLSRHKRIHAKAQLKDDKAKNGNHWQVTALADPNVVETLPANPPLDQLPENELGHYLSQPMQFSPSHIRTDHDFENLPTNSVLDVILNIES